jgi:hypothetical protein
VQEPRSANLWLDQKRGAGHDQPFIFSEESQQVMNDLSKTAINGLADYASRLASGIYQRLFAYTGATIPNTSLISKDLVARGLLIGSVAGRVESAQIVFPHQNGVLLPPVLREVREAPTEFCIFSGSALVWNDLQSRFSAPRSLSEAANLVRIYIQRCADMRHDYADCQNIGGHIHIAFVTADKTGWINPPRDNAALWIGGKE